MIKITSFIAASVLAILLFPHSLSAAVEVPGSDYYYSGDVALFNGAIYLFSSTHYSSTYGADWSTWGTIPIPATRLSTFGRPHPIEFNGRLYVFWTDSASNTIYYMSMNQLGVWDTVVSTIPGGAKADYAIGLATFNGRLYAMWRAQGNNTSLFYASMATNNVWSATARLSTGESSQAPTATILRGTDGIDRLYAFWKDRNIGADPMWYASMAPGGSWSSSTKINTSDYPLTSRRPSVGSSGSRLYLTYRGGYDDTILLKEMDSAGNWYAERTIACCTGNEPSTVWFNGALWVFWPEKEAYNGIFYQQFN
jgi:hypothetical protein